MANSSAKAALDHFLASPGAESIALKGPWGAGKTYLWKQAVAQRTNATRIENYAYVSLFGLNSISEVRAAIFADAADPDAAEPQRSDNSTAPASKAKGLLKAAFSGRGVKKGLEAVVQNRANAGELYRQFTFSLVRRYLVCIDDLERRGSGLALADVLGLVNFLKEERECKVVTILNEDALGENRGAAGSLESLDSMREKVFDREIRFSPDAREMLDILLDAADPFGDGIRRHVAAFGIANMRILRRIIGAVGTFSGYIQRHQSTEDHALRSIILVTWAYYARGNDVPPYEFVSGRAKNLNPMQETELEEVAAKWSERLSGFAGPGPLEAHIGQFLEDGVIASPDGLDSSLQTLAAQLGNNSSTAQFQQAALDLTETLSDDTGNIARRLAEASKGAAPFVGLRQMNQIIRLLVLAQQDEYAKTIADAWSEENVLTYRVPGRPRFASSDVLRRALSAAEARQVSAGVVFDRVMGRTEPVGLNVLELSVLAKVSCQEYVDHIRLVVVERGLPGTLNPLIGAIEQTKIPVAEDLRFLRKTLREALSKIGSKSALDMARLKPYVERLTT